MKIMLYGIIGAAIGFGLGYFARCSSGSCPLMANMVLMTSIGAITGILAALSK